MKKASKAVNTSQAIEGYKPSTDKKVKEKVKKLLKNRRGNKKLHLFLQ